MLHWSVLGALLAMTACAGGPAPAGAFLDAPARGRCLDAVQGPAPAGHQPTGEGACETCHTCQGGNGAAAGAIGWTDSIIGRFYATGASPGPVADASGHTTAPAEPRCDACHRAHRRKLIAPGPRSQLSLAPPAQ